MQSIWTGLKFCRLVNSSRTVVSLKRKRQAITESGKMLFGGFLPLKRLSRT